MMFDLDREREKAEQEKRKLAEELERTKTEYEQALAHKSREVNAKLETNKKAHGRTNAQGKSRSY